MVKLLDVLKTMYSVLKNRAIECIKHRLFFQYSHSLSCLHDFESQMLQCIYAQYVLICLHVKILHANISKHTERKYIEAFEIQNRGDKIMNGCPFKHFENSSILNFKCFNVFTLTMF